MSGSNGYGSGGVLTPLRRNRFPYGKLMDTRHWELEQDYGIQARRLINRLGLGAGVLCGLRVRIEEEAVLVEPGVAVDARGREIVVTETVRLEHVNQPTDDCARPVGDPVRDGPVTIWLCYRECGSEYVRLAAGDCGHQDRCTPGLLDERFALRIGEGTPDSYPGLSEVDCRHIFPGPHDPRKRRAAVARLLGGCPAPGEPCIALAMVAIDNEVPVDVDMGYRTTLFSNEELFDLLMCLAARVEDCCRLPEANPPRLLSTWPPLGAELSPGDWSRFIEGRRLELVIERQMRDLGLDQPDPWLGMWQVGGRGARRLRIARAGGPIAHVPVGAGQEGVAYRVEIEEQRLDAETAFVVMVSSKPGGPIAASDNGAALDAELAATALSDAERQKLWSLAPGQDWANTTVRDHVFVPAAPSLPSGNGVEGGELHGAFGRLQAEPELPPQLLTVFPPGGAVLTPWEDEAARRFADEPRLELTVSRRLADSAWDDVYSWLRVFVAIRDNGIRHFRPVEIGAGGATDHPILEPPPDSATYVVKLDPAAVRGRRELLVVIRPGAAGAGAEPLGADPPEVLLDADFLGTSLTKQDVLSVWEDGSLPAPPVELNARSTLGEPLYDGSPGGFVHYSFATHTD